MSDQITDRLTEAPDDDDVVRAEDIRRLVLLAIGCVCAIALIEFVRRGAARMNQRIAGRHPVAAAIEELARPEWHRH